jgi:isocitrate dehydrogenase
MTLERAVIETVESGKMTKDLALCISGGKDVARSSYRSTSEFMSDIKETLDRLRNGSIAKAKL